MAALVACGGGSDSGPQPATVSVGGTLAGLGAGKSVVIGDASGPSAALSANGNYALSLPVGTAYSLRVLGQPAGQTCTLSNGTGTASADVATVGVACLDDIAAPDARIINGTVTGLGAGKSVVLQLAANGATQETAVNADGGFQFAVPVAGDVTVTVKTAPPGQACTVAGGAAITVTCAASTSSFRLGGTVSGNIGVVALRNTANGDTVTLNTNGVFTFPQPVLQGAAYQVVVFDQSGNQTCGVASGAGASNADVDNIQVSCAAAVAVAPPPMPAAAPSAPTGLTMTYGIKSFHLAWGTVTAPAGGGSVTYRLFEDPDGAGPAASAQIGGSLFGVTYTQAVTGLLHTRLNAQYAVQACNGGGCSSPSAAVTPNLTQAIGYFKAGNTDAGDQFASSVALSADGGTLAVATYFERSNATGINGNSSNNSAIVAGAVYVFARSAGTWAQQAYVKASNTQTGDSFGYSVALSADGNTLAVGAQLEYSSATGINGDQADNSAPAAGAVYVFSRSAGAWTQQAYVKASNTQAGDWFGSSVALSGDGNTLAVGAFREDSSASGINAAQANNLASDAGAVYVYARSAGTWAQQAYVKASNPQADDWFGYSVALSADGSTLAVGAYTEDSSATGVNGNQLNDLAPDAGAAYVFVRSAGLWSQQAYVKASNTGAGDGFGGSVALSADGNTLAVGSAFEDSNATGVNGNQADNSRSSAGAAYVFTRSGGTWAQEAYVKASNLAALFGESIALSADGNQLAVAARGEASNATGINGNQANNLATNSGAAYLFARSAGTWTQQAYVKASNTGFADSFGSSVALSADGSTLAVGANNESSSATGVSGNQADNGAGQSGAAYLY